MEWPYIIVTILSTAVLAMLGWFGRNLIRNLASSISELNLRIKEEIKDLNTKIDKNYTNSHNELKDLKFDIGESKKILQGINQDLIILQTKQSLINAHNDSKFKEIENKINRMEEKMNEFKMDVSQLKNEIHGYIDNNKQQ